MRMAGGCNDSGIPDGADCVRFGISTTYENNSAHDRITHLSLSLAGLYPPARDRNEGIIVDRRVRSILSIGHATVRTTLVSCIDP